MFKQRVITGLLLALVASLILYYSNTYFFTAVSILLLVGCALEWLQLIPFTQWPAKCLFLGSLLIAMVGIQYLFNTWLALGGFVWVIIAFAIVRFPKSQSLWGCPYRIAAFAVVLLPLFAQSLINLFAMPEGKALILYLFLLVCSADTGAYLTGKVCGRHKLIPEVSPGKTIEGAFGGALLTCVVALAAFPYFKTHLVMSHQYPLAPWLLMAAVVFIMALIGDLSIILLKRRVHLKDTGALFPGHGGLLDRLDSLIAAAPAFYFIFCALTQGT